MYDYELYTIGAGSGGVAATRRAGNFGVKAGICESIRAGGTCVLRGCIPKKLLIYAAHVSEQIEDAAGYGWTIPTPSFDWRALITAKDTELDRLNGIYERMLADAKVDLHPGKGRLIDAHTVEIEGADGTRRVTAKTILIATGGWPKMEQIPGIEHAISSNEALELPRLPKHIVIVGGGYIAVEFAGIFNALGSEVLVLIRRDLILGGFDEDVRRHLQAEMERQGITIRPGCKITEIRKDGDRLILDNTDGVGLETEQVLFATGRAPNTLGLGLEEAGVVLGDNGAIEVDDCSKTSLDNIYAVGDCTDRVNLTPVAISEARMLVDRLYASGEATVDYREIPTAIFSDPEIGTVGLSEEQARLNYGDIEVYRSVFRPLKNTLSGNMGRTLMKIIVDKASDRVVGCHMVGGDAGEIIQGVGIALKCGATKAQFDATMAIHPTAAEEFVTMQTPVRPGE